MLKDIGAVDLGAMVIGEALRRSGIEPAEVDEVIMGNALQAGLGQNPARQAAMKAGLPDTVPAMTVNKVCGSGLKAINLAVQAINAGEADVVVAGGMENMSQAPFLLRGARWGYRLGNNELTDSLLQDGLWDVFGDCHMGITAETLAEKYGITRAEQDSFALLSQKRTETARKKGRFKNEILPVTVPRKKGEALTFDEDEHPRPDTTLEKLAQLRPAFKREGTVTAGNASGINDGAAAVIVMSEDKAAKSGISAMCRVRACASVAVDPGIMGIGAAVAVRAVLKKANIALRDIDSIEVNEAFAAQLLAVGKELNWDQEKVNVNGGAIALGHPIGASGARILVTLLHEIGRTGSRLGLAALCVGGGQGVATVVEHAEA